MTPLHAPMRSPLRTLRHAAPLLALALTSAPLRAQAAQVKVAPDLHPALELVPAHLAGQSEALTLFDVVALPVPADTDRPFTLELQHEGASYTLELDKTSVRSGDFQVVETGTDGSYVVVDPGPVRTFKGRVREDKSAVVVGALLPTGLEAHIELSDGRRLMVEPLYEAFAAGERDLYVVYDHDTTPHDHTLRCSTDGGPVRGPTDTEGGTEGLYACGGDFCVADIAFDVDNSFYQYWSSNTQQAQAVTEYLMLIANIQYIRDVEIRHVITTMLVRAGGDPAGYASAVGTASLMAFFQNEWNANNAGIPRDTAHLLTNRFEGGHANIGVICNVPSAYAVSGPAAAYGLRCIAHVLSHELGHNWGSGHCDCSGINGPAYTMNPTFPPCALRFHPTLTVPVIRAHRDSRACLRAGVINDSRADAIEVGPVSTTLGTTTNATVDGSTSCGGSNSTPDVWYFYRPRTSGLLVVMTCNNATNFDTVLSVHNGYGSSIACNDDSSCAVASTQSVLSVSVTGGELYYIRVSGFNGARGIFGLRMDSGPAAVQPFNDNRANAMEIGPGVYYGTTIAATQDGSSICSSTGADVWYSYTPRVNDWATVDTCRATPPGIGGSLFDTVLSVHDVNGNELFCNDNYCHSGSVVQWYTTSGVTYLIRVSGFSTLRGGYRLSLAGPELAHDVCVWPKNIGTGTRMVTLQGAYISDGDVPCLPNNSDEPNLFYRYTNNQSCPGVLHVSTCGTNDLGGIDQGVDTVLSLHAYCPAGAGTSFGCNDDAGLLCGASTGLLRDSYLQTTLSPYQSVVIQLTRYSPVNGHDPILLTTSFEPLLLVPPNDDCEDAIAVAPGQYTGSLCAATNDGSASCGGSQTTPDMWYSFEAPMDGTLTVTTCGTNDYAGQIDANLDTVLSLHANVCPATVSTELVCNDDASICGLVDQGAARDSAVSRFLVAGETVLIRVAWFSSAVQGGAFVLNVDFELGEGYCTPTRNSATSGAVIEAFGGASIGANNFGLLVTDAPPNKPGLFFLGPNQVNLPFGEGRRCVGGATKRIQPPAATDGSGTVSRILNFNQPYGAFVFAGSTGINYQYWFRDPNVDSDGDGTAEDFNLSTAINVVHTP